MANDPALRLCGWPPCGVAVTRPGQRFCSPGHRRRSWGLTKEGRPVLAQADALRLLAMARVSQAATTAALDRLERALLYGSETNIGDSTSANSHDQPRAASFVSVQPESSPSDTNGSSVSGTKTTG
jgi:hypothetical protein